MSQHDYVIDNQDGASFRADINSALASIVSCNSGPTAPAATFAYQVWHDTTAGIIKQRNGTNTAWLDLADVLLAGKTVTGDVTVVGNVTYTNQITQAATQATTSGTFKDFTGIPSWVKRITVMLNGVSTSGASPVIVQIGSTTFTTTGYAGTSVVISSGTVAASTTTGFQLFFNTSDAAAAVRHGVVQINNMTGNAWVGSVSGGLAGGTAATTGAASVSLAGVLDRIRITTVNGTDTFDAGSVNIIYE